MQEPKHPWSEEECDCGQPCACECECGIFTEGDCAKHNAFWWLLPDDKLLDPCAKCAAYWERGLDTICTHGPIIKPAPHGKERK